MPILSDAVYDLDEVSEILGHPPRWLKENLIRPGKLKTFRAGRRRWVLGKNLIECVEREQSQGHS